MDECVLLLSDFIRDMDLEIVYLPDSKKNLQIFDTDINRPALQIAGYFNHFDESRIQLFGMVEHDYLLEMSPEERLTNMDKLFSFDFPCLILTRGYSLPDEILALAEKHERPVLRTDKHTSSFSSRAIFYINSVLGPQVQRHGVLVEVYGEGILLLGESGVGKSETAIELVKRGHQLIADDAVIIKKTSSTTLTGTSPELTRYFIELRGIGIVNVRRIFGIGAVLEKTDIDMVINIENWETGKTYERLGMDAQYEDILGVKLPSITLPVKPGRNLAVIIEVAAMNNRQRRMGYNAAKELDDKIKDMELGSGKGE